MISNDTIFYWKWYLMVQYMYDMQQKRDAALASKIDKKWSAMYDSLFNWKDEAACKIRSGGRQKQQYQEAISRFINIGSTNIGSRCK